MKIIVSGCGCICALGNNIVEITKNLFVGNSAPSIVCERLKSSYCAQYPVFQVSKEILAQKKEDESYSYLFLRKSLQEAIEKAGLQISDLKNARIGVCIGTTVDVSFNCFDFYKELKTAKNPPLEPLDKYIHYSTAKEVLKQLGLNGISQTVVTACASGTDAIGIGAEWIENSMCDVVIAGGCDELNMIPYTGFIKLMVASKELCKPFDKNRAGINLGEGAGIVIMESREFAAKRNAKKIGAVLGYGNACDGYHTTSPEPSGRGLRKALNFALRQSNIKFENIAFINAHATGTQDNDMAEAVVFNSVLKNIPVSATKSLTGHTLGAAGAVEACISLICLNEGKIPAVKNFITVDDKLNLVPALLTQKIDNSKAAISDSLAFGGCNAVLALGGKNYE
ncbi:beta-ketoacyl-[acyl-carrier-protein] synthase family protein [Endomicrobium proavitum]|uniref:Nodulation protein E n=1 Tax=Endomicrobium proavitum TaxID=1408281 RepID=A0A0G3WLC9_9BACT|nr:beta-ketoacyl-[acyl-carrier-protein] synthase family protein [Endomicrobium proavitum]AKL98314.1 Beta-ketoacyl-acyl-carrier-protein synthase I [Endomicrobium proavitum]